MTRITRPLSPKRRLQLSPTGYRMDHKSPNGERQVSRVRALVQTLRDLPVATAWTIVLALGGLQLLVFFATVGFVPNLDLKAAASLLAATALLGVALAGAIAVMFALPSIVLASTCPIPVGNYQITRHIMESAIGVLAVPLFTMIMQIRSPGGNVQEARSHLLAQLLAFLGLLVCYVLVVRRIESSGKKRRVVERIDDYFNALLRIFGWLTWSAVVGLITALLVRTGGMEIFYLTYLGLPLVVSFYSIILFAFADKGRWVRIAALGAFSAVVHSMLTGQPLWFIHTTIERLGYSYGAQLMRVVLTESGCAIVNVALGVPAAAEAPAANRKAWCVPDPTTKMGIVYARITSRIGSPFVLEIPEQEAEKNSLGKSGTTRAVSTRRVLVKADDVLTWLYEPPPGRIPAPTSK